jgi:hypothetical protein
MLPKLVYSKVVQALKKMKEHWDLDRVENPNMAPYEIDIPLRAKIETAMREGGMHLPRDAKERTVEGTFDYLRSKGLIVRSPYGGHFFPLPPGAVIPTKEQLMKRINADIDRKFFGKPVDFTDD